MYCIKLIPDVYISLNITKTSHVVETHAENHKWKDVNTKLSGTHTQADDTNTHAWVQSAAPVKLHVRQTWFFSEARISSGVCSWSKPWQDGAWDGSACRGAWWTPTCSPPPPPLCLPYPRCYSSLRGIRVQHGRSRSTQLWRSESAPGCCSDLCVLTGSDAANSLCWEVRLECRERSDTRHHSQASPPITLSGDTPWLLQIWYPVEAGKFGAFWRRKDKRCVGLLVLSGQIDAHT